MIILNDEFLAIKIVYTNNLLIIAKEGEIVYREFFLERDEAEDFALEYITGRLGYIKQNKREKETEILGSLLKNTIG